MNDNKSFMNQGTVQNGPLAGAAMSSFGRNTELTGVEAQEVANPVTFKREPDRDLEEEGEFGSLDIDRLLS